jgi:hypothetical protein
MGEAEREGGIKHRHRMSVLHSSQPATSLTHNNQQNTIDLQVPSSDSEGGSESSNGERSDLEGQEGLVVYRGRDSLSIGQSER